MTFHHRLAKQTNQNGQFEKQPDQNGQVEKRVGGRGRRSPRLLLELDERDRYLIEAAKFFPGLSDRETARLLRSRLQIYQQGRWRRSRSEIWCPHPADRVEAVLWALLRVRDAIPSERTIRAAIASRSR